MKKIIHYCWFGDKNLPKLAKRCLKSWKKHLPDYEIMLWNEANFDVNITPFSASAYKNKKWAFVSDVVRCYALKEFGGIYFDTDMLVKTDISDILKKEFYAGWESPFHVAVGIMGTKEPNHPVINDLWEFYEKTKFNPELAYEQAIPKILTKILYENYQLSSYNGEIQVLNNGITIYPIDYFYPISAEYNENFTANTKMIHYYSGSWIVKEKKSYIVIKKIFGEELGKIVLDFLMNVKKSMKSFLKIILYLPIKRKKDKKKKMELVEFKNEIEKLFSKNNNKYVIFCNKNWLGTRIAAEELFENVIPIPELTDKSQIEYLANYIIQSEIELVIFSAFSKGWINLIEKIKTEKNNVKFKVIWHGSHAMNVETYDWLMFQEIFEMYNRKLLKSIIFVKKSMYDFYKMKDYNVEFLYNRVSLKKTIKEKKSLNGKTKIGLYASGDRWVKNFYNQLGAASLFDNCEIDCIPLNEKIIKMANIFKTDIYGETNTVNRLQLLERLASNDINIYTTFTECAPLLPLESLELGVPCITGNNHSYWSGTELEEYLIVNKADDCIEIYNKAQYCIENKEKIIQLYKKWKLENNKLSIESVRKVLEGKK